MFLVVVLCLVITLIYLLDRHRLNFWSIRGFKQHPTKFLVGNAGQLFAMKISIGEFFKEFYDKYKDHRIIGIYLSYKPILIINDPKLAQSMLIRNFDSFHDRPMPVNEKLDPLSAHLFNMEGSEWRKLRAKLTPLFTSGKLKGMFPVIEKSTDVLIEYLSRSVSSCENVFDIGDLMSRYNINVISSVAFGIDNDCINDPNHIFHRMGKKFFETTFVNGIRTTLIFLGGRDLLYKTPLKTIDSDFENFIFSIVKQTIDHREQTNFSRNDFMQLMIQLKNQGYVKSEKSDNCDNVSDNRKMTFNEVAAQVFVFFLAGFETSSSTQSFCLYELARHPKIFKKVQEEIDRVFKSSIDGESFSYEKISELRYLECCIDEALRKYPIVPALFRTATNDYRVPDSDLVIPKGTSVYFPVLGYQRDPEMYENPMEYKPERFFEATTGTSYNDGKFYLPFGDGPRNCIGMRMSKISTKLVIANILFKFNLELEDLKETNDEVKFNPRQFILTPVKRFRIKFTPR